MRGFEELPENLDVHQLELDVYTGLFRLNGQLLQHPEMAAECICQAITSLTRGLFQLVLHPGKHVSKAPDSVPANAARFPVCDGTHTYGTLYLTAPASVTISIYTGERIADCCAAFLSLLEKSVFIQQRIDRIERLDYRVPPLLTEQQHNVLILICRGYSDGEIARELGIAVKTAGTHRQNIHRLLNVRKSDDVAYIAFHHHLYSPVGLTGEGRQARDRLTVALQR